MGSGARGKTNMLETCLTLGEWTFRTQPVFHSSACYRWGLYWFVTWLGAHRTRSEVDYHNCHILKILFLSGPSLLCPVTPLRWQLCQISTRVEAETQSFHQCRGQETLQQRSHGQRWGGQQKKPVCLFFFSCIHCGTTRPFVRKLPFWWMFSWEKQPPPIPGSSGRGFIPQSHGQWADCAGGGTPAECPTAEATPGLHATLATRDAIP